MDWPELAKAVGEFIKTVGFPIAVAAFVLVRLDGTLRELRDAVKAFGTHTEQGRTEAVAEVKTAVFDAGSRVISEVTHDTRAALSSLVRQLEDRK